MAESTLTDADCGDAIRLLPLVQSLGEMLSKAEEKTERLEAGTHTEMSIEQVRRYIDEAMLIELGPDLHAKWKERRAQLGQF
jgi:hypothetical protein